MDPTEGVGVYGTCVGAADTLGCTGCAGGHYDVGHCVGAGAGVGGEGGEVHVLDEERRGRESAEVENEQRRWRKEKGERREKNEVKK